MNYWKMASFLVLGLTSYAGASNILINPGFELYPGQGTDYRVGIGKWPSEAPWWSVQNFYDGMTTSGLVSPGQGLSDIAMYVTESVPGNVIEQDLTLYGLGDTPIEHVSGWLDVTAGSVGLGLIDPDGTLHVVASSGVTSGYVQLSVDLITPIETNQFVIVSLSNNTAYYADNMDADPTPEPASFAALSLGVLCLLRRKRRT